MTCRGRDNGVKLDGKQEAHLVAVACSAAPEGHTALDLAIACRRGGEAAS